MARIVVALKHEQFYNKFKEVITAGISNSDVVFAENHKATIRSIDKNKTDILILDLRLPTPIEGIQVLFHFYKKRYQNPILCIIPAAAQTLYNETANKESTINFLVEPVKYRELQLRVVDCYDKLQTQSSYLLKLSDICIVISLTKITCTLTITESDKRGTIYFRDGIILNAQWLSTQGWEALHALFLQTVNPTIEFSSKCKNMTEIINTPFTAIALPTPEEIIDEFDGKQIEDKKFFDDGVIPQNSLFIAHQSVTTHTELVPEMKDHDFSSLRNENKEEQPSLQMAESLQDATINEQIKEDYLTDAPDATVLFPRPLTESHDGENELGEEHQSEQDQTEIQQFESEQSKQQTIEQADRDKPDEHNEEIDKNELTHEDNVLDEESSETPVVPATTKSSELLSFIEKFSNDSKINTSDKPEIESSLDQNTTKFTIKEKLMTIQQSMFDQLKSINGFYSAALYTDNGEIVIGTSIDSHDMGYFGALANEMYLNARDIAEKMVLGTANFLEIHTENHVFLHCCIFSINAALGVVLSNSGNIGLAKYEMKKICQQIVAEFDKTT